MNEDLRAEIMSEVAYGSQGTPCRCSEEDEERYELYCFRHRVAGYGIHAIGYGCHRCDAHFFFRPDWTTDECRPLPDET